MWASLLLGCAIIAQATLSRTAPKDLWIPRGGDVQERARLLFAFRLDLPVHGDVRHERCDEIAVVSYGDTCRCHPRFVHERDRIGRWLEAVELDAVEAEETLQVLEFASLLENLCSDRESVDVRCAPGRGVGPLLELREMSSRIAPEENARVAGGHHLTNGLAIHGILRHGHTHVVWACDSTSERENSVVSCQSHRGVVPELVENAQHIRRRHVLYDDSQPWKACTDATNGRNEQLLCGVGGCAGKFCVKADRDVQVLSERKDLQELFLYEVVDALLRKRDATGCTIDTWWEHWVDLEDESLLRVECFLDRVRCRPERGVLHLLYDLDGHERFDGRACCFDFGSVPKNTCEVLDWSDGCNSVRFE